MSMISHSPSNSQQLDFPKSTAQCLSMKTNCHLNIHRYSFCCLSPEFQIFVTSDKPPKYFPIWMGHLYCEGMEFGTLTLSALLGLIYRYTTAQKTNREMQFLGRGKCDFEWHWRQHLTLTNTQLHHNTHTLIMFMAHFVWDPHCNIRWSGHFGLRLA